MTSHTGPTTESAPTSSEVPVVSEKTSKFLSMLHGYLDTRKQMDAKYQQEDPDQLLANLDVGSERANPSYTKELQQQSITGEPVKDLDELYEAAKLAKPVYEKIVQKLVDHVHEAIPEGHDEDDDEVVFAPLKGADRALEKAKDDYADRVPGPGVSWLFDIVRGSIKFTSTAELCKCMELLISPPSSKEGGEAEFRLVKAKNRFQNPTLSGYRDFNVCIQITVPNIESGGSFQHICELQIHHIGIKSMSKLLSSHSLYEFFRSYFDGATTSLSDRMEDLEYIAKGEKLDAEYLINLVKTCADEKRLFRILFFFCDFLSEYELAIRAGERIIDIRKDIPFEEFEETEQYGMEYYQIARVYQLQGSFEKALEFYGKNVDIRLKVSGSDDLGITGTHIEMGKVYDQQLGKPEEALVLYKKAEASLVEALGLYSPASLELYSSMAGIYQKVGDFDHAEEMCGKVQLVIEEIRNLKSEDFFPVGETLCNIAEIRYMLGKTEEAVELYKEAAKILVRKLGPYHPSVQKAEKQLADAVARIKLAETAT